VSFPKDFLDEIKIRLPVSVVVGRAVKLKRRGKVYWGLSPFSNEKTPSFSVDDQKAFYHCFSTQEHGDIFNFVMKTQRLSFPEAVEYLANEAGLEVPKLNSKEIAQTRNRNELLKIVEIATKFYENQLFSDKGKQARDYLLKRGVSDDIIRKFRIGYAPGNNELKNNFRNLSIPEKLLFEARLLSNSSKTKESYDFFRNRIVFPIMDITGRPIAFGGRVLGEGQPKYLNSSDSLIFHKRNSLYGLSIANEIPIENDEVIVTEGYMDVLVLFQADIRNAVASLGTALTEQQIKLLWRSSSEPVLCFDGDEAGRKAALRVAERSMSILRPGNSIKFSLLPAGKDPDDIVTKKGKRAFEDIVKSAIPLSEMIWLNLISNREFDTPERRAALEKEAYELVGMISDNSVKIQYKNFFREKLFSFFKRKSLGFSKKMNNFSANIPAANEVSPHLMRQKILLATLLSHPELFDEIEERLGSMQFSDLRLDIMRREVLKHLSISSGIEFLETKRHLTSLGFIDEFNELISNEIFTHAGFARPDADIDNARRGWNETYLLCKREDLERDIQIAAEDFKKNPSEANYTRFEKLRFEEQEIFINKDY